MRNKSDILNQLVENVVVAVVRASSPDDALRIVNALNEGGIKSIEITMTVPGAILVMEEVSKRLSEQVLLGAGTVLDAETSRSSISAGAEFIVSPCCRAGVIDTATRYGKVVMPGALTPDEIVTAWEMGADVVKVFPINRVGGAAYIKSIKEPFPQILLNPSGGVNLENLADYLCAGASLVSVGGDLVDVKAIRERHFEVLKDKSKLFADRVKSLKK